MSRESVLDAVNKRTYASRGVVRWYADLDSLIKPEEALLAKLLPHIKDKKILDVGIGGGRTTKFLLEISKDYTGIDYTPESVEVVRGKYQGANVLCRDARDLTLFADGTFDFVLVSFNSLDYVNHEGRIKALTEMRRVLRPGGFFMFSTHNRDYRYFNKLPWQEKARLDLTHLKSCLYTLYHLPKHLGMKRREVHARDYAIINDNAHEYSLLTYYIGIRQQVKQLEDVGFVSVEAYDMEGRPVSSDTDFPWTYYLARK